MTVNTERIQRRELTEPERKSVDDDGPSKPGIDRPKVPSELLKRMKNIDPNQAKKYRQRSGQ
ncbi:MAG: ubiquitin-like protein UBact [Armatimonadetes bacterium]|nr:ubiquitin-like protein UBact [Armatimonadota bacterium]